MKEIILASASPRRQELLQQIKLPYTVRVSQVNEEIESEDPERVVQELALRKAIDVANQIQNGIIIGADTIVYANGMILGKPNDITEASKMLNLLSGARHYVYTGIAIVEVTAGAIKRSQVDFERTSVIFKNLNSCEIENYIASGEPMDKAGAYAIQGVGAVFVKKIEGCYYNVVGLPLFCLTENLKNFGISVIKA